MKCRCINFYLQTVGIIVSKLQSTNFGINDINRKTYRLRCNFGIRTKNILDQRYIVMKIGYYTIEKFKLKN